MWPSTRLLQRLYRSRARSCGHGDLILEDFNHQRFVRTQPSYARNLLIKRSSLLGGNSTHVNKSTIFIFFFLLRIQLSGRESEAEREIRHLLVIRSRFQAPLTAVFVWPSFLCPCVCVCVSGKTRRVLFCEIWVKAVDKFVHSHTKNKKNITYEPFLCGYKVLHFVGDCVL